MDTDEVDEIKRQEDEEAHKSGVDRANDLLNKARRLRQLKNTATVARTGASVAEGAGTAAGSAEAATAAAAGAEAVAAGATAAEAAAVGATAVPAVAAGVGGISISLPFIIIGLLLLIIFAAVIVILTAGNTNAGEPLPPTDATCESVGGQCSADTTCADVPESVPDTTLTCNDPANPTATTCCVPKDVSCETNPVLALKQNYNVTVSTTVVSQLKEICNILSIPARSDTYKNLLKGAGPTNITFDSESCGGSVRGRGIMVLHSFFSGCSPSTRTFVLIHETGHIIAFGSGRLYQTSFSSAYYPQDQACYTLTGRGAYLKTYPSIGGGGGGRAESFAESLLDYVLPGYASGNGLNYRASCQTGWAWESANIFGGTIF